MNRLPKTLMVETSSICNINPPCVHCGRNCPEHPANKTNKLLDDELLNYPIEEKKPKVPFGNLLENKLINIGDYLYSKDEKYKAKILVDATLMWNDKVGSIHKISAEILGKVSNNGWTYWHTKDKKGNLILIDEIRNEYIKKCLT